MSFLEQMRANLRPADFLDVLIIAVLLYSALYWLRRRTSAAVALTFGLVGLLYVAAYLFKMYLTLMLFHAGLSIILVSLVIIFQQDLRRGFERLAAWNPFDFRNRSRTDWSATIDTLTESLAMLAEARIGALVVLPGREPLESQVRGGVPLGGEISIPILHSIFHPESHGHDGAVLIEDNRISRFAVHLPLSSNLAAVREGGTRHTAALGLAERSDAIILVVSEERGTVSVAEDGRLEVLPTPAALRERLEAWWHERFPPAAQRSWWPWLTHNAALKVLAGCLACFMWFTLAYRVATVQRSFEDVPIEYRNLPDGWVIAESAPTKTRVTLSGPERAFSTLEPKTLTVAIDVSQPQEGPNEVMPNGGNLELPADLSVRQPDTSPVRFDVYPKTEAVTLPVRVRLRGTGPPGLRRDDVRAEPAQVSVIIRSIDREKIKEVDTAPVPVDGLRETTTVGAELILPPHARFPDGRRPAVRVTLPVEQPAAAKGEGS